MTVSQETLFEAFQREEIMNGDPSNKEIIRRFLAGQQVLTTRVVLVTPKQAKVWLKSNDSTKNRGISQRRVAAYANDMRHGNWQLTHQGICFGLNGVLIDGQHRLLAVILANVSVLLVVTEMATIDDPHKSLADQGGPRPHAYILNDKSNTHASVAAMLGQFAQGNGSHATVETERTIIAALRKEVDDVCTVPAERKCRVSPIMAALVLRRAVDGDDVYALEQYRLFGKLETNGMSSRVLAFYKEYIRKGQTMTGKTAARAQLLARTFFAFLPNGQPKFNAPRRVDMVAPVRQQLRALLVARGCPVFWDEKRANPSNDINEDLQDAAVELCMLTTLQHRGEAEYAYCELAGAMRHTGLKFSGDRFTQALHRLVSLQLVEAYPAPGMSRRAHMFRLTDAGRCKLGQKP